MTIWRQQNVALYSFNWSVYTYMSIFYIWSQLKIYLNIWYFWLIWQSKPFITADILPWPIIEFFLLDFMKTSLCIFQNVQYSLWTCWPCYVLPALILTLTASQLTLRQKCLRYSKPFFFLNKGLTLRVWENKVYMSREINSCCKLSPSRITTQCWWVFKWTKWHSRIINMD